jgi:hypothetical protein
VKIISISIDRQSKDYLFKENLVEVAMARGGGGDIIGSWNRYQIELRSNGLYILGLGRPAATSPAHRAENIIEFSINPPPSYVIVLFRDGTLPIP